jgi:pimeloyl-ACP methyl ester carboxylesterase
MSAAGMPAGTVTLAAMGSFTVGGRRVEVSGRPERTVTLSPDLPPYVVDVNGTYQADHAYVQYFLPARPRGLPLVLVHGGGLTGSCWESTPDGRSGWAWHFLRAGHPVYVVDNVERGRAGWDALGWGAERAPLSRSAQEAWTVFRIGPPEGFDEARPYPGCLFPVDDLAALSAMTVPRWTTTTGLAIAAIEAVLARVGRCAVIAHSQGGGIAAHAAARSPEHVAALVLIEPHSLPGAGGSDGRAGGPGGRAGGPGGRAGGPGGGAAAPRLIVAGDFIEQSPVYRGLRAEWHGHLGDLAAGGTRADYFSLPAMGHPGNSHAPMMDANSDVVAALVNGWIERATTG